MANSNRKGMYALGLIILAVVAVYVIAPDTFIGLSVGGKGGVQTPPPTGGDVGVQTYEGPVTINLVQRNAIDSAEERVDGVDVVTNYFKKVGGAYKAIGSGSGNTVNIDRTTNQIWMASQVPTGSDLYIAPSSTSDSNLNPRIKGFDFFDITGDGEKEWVFTVDMTGLSIRGGQTTPTVDLFVDSFTAAVPVFVSPPVDQLALSTASGNRVFVEWDVANGPTISSAYPVYELEVKINSTTTAKWDRGSSELVIPNLGTISLGDMERQISGTDTIYTCGKSDQCGTSTFTLKDANYVTIPQNTQNKTDWDLEIVTNFGAGEAYQVTLTIRYILPDLGSNEVTDTAVLAT